MNLIKSLALGLSLSLASFAAFAAQINLNTASATELGGIPWLALLDDRVAKATSDGVYVIYLFREDMSGVYATLNQGITKAKERLGSEAGRETIRQRSEELRRFAGRLSEAGFALSNEIELHTEHSLGKDYQHGTVAHRLYESGCVPPTRALLEDLRLLVDAYDGIVTAQLARRV